ncbi:MAG: hypothetical protein ACT4QF_01430 [Sporichthyaceae bacterium]
MTGLIAGVVAGGAAVQQWRSASDEPHLVGQDARIVVDGARDRPVMLAGPTGQLRYYIPGRCLVIDTSGGPTLAPSGIDSAVPLGTSSQKPPIQEAPVDARDVSWFSAVWPHGTKVIKDGDRFGVRLADGSAYWVGDKVEGAGGAWGEDDDGVQPTFGLSPNCVGFGMTQLVPDPSLPR